MVGHRLGDHGCGVGNGWVLKMAQVSAAALEVKTLSECFMERLFLSLIVLR
jgi:hypothetical protein